MERRPTHILFDFFGTLVDHSAAGDPLGFRGSHRYLLDLGADLGYDEFLAGWAGTYEEFDRASALDHREFSMADVGGAYLRSVLGHDPTPAQLDGYLDRYLAEWNGAVRHLPGMPRFLAALRRDHRLAVVSNTHDDLLVPGHLDAMGVRDLMDAVVLSIEVGWRKPHPEIYATALRGLGIGPADAVFVGDTYRADFQGPERVGIRAYLIDPGGRAPVPPDRRLGSVFELPDRLVAG